MINNKNKKWIICDSKRIKINRIKMINDKDKKEEIIRDNKKSDEK